MLTKIASGTIFFHYRCEYVKTEGSEVDLMQDIQIFTARAQFFHLGQNFSGISSNEKRAGWVSEGLEVTGALLCGKTCKCS